MNYTELRGPEAGDTVVVGMSGGVDSTLAALLLKERGCHVIGVTMSLWKGDLPPLPDGSRLRNSCYGPDEALDIAECADFCAEHGIEYHVIDVKDIYQREVLDYFKAEYRAGRTPNPCIRCNRHIKFGALLEGVAALGIRYDYFCTGHYARIVQPDFPLPQLYGEHEDKTDIRPCMIHCAADSTKDQTYFLYRIPSETLRKVRFPLADFTKKHVFEMARERGLKSAEKSESQDFVPPEIRDALFADRPSIPGDFIDLDGHKLGRHCGIEHYTVGQRRGLGISADVPLYVHSIQSDTNRIVLARDEDLFAKGLIADDWVWPAHYEPRASFRAGAKIRLASRPVPVSVEPFDAANDAGFANAAFSGAPYRIIFDEAQRAVAPGQSVVLYIDGVVCGGGIIHTAI